MSAESADRARSASHRGRSPRTPPGEGFAPLDPLIRWLGRVVPAGLLYPAGVVSLPRVFGATEL
ncbi:hypothetical protein JOF41_005614 [Saccharothrix coeruleofusca]|nr:hypothetical protein [Saccharothrix coeruleofusca]